MEGYSQPSYIQSEEIQFIGSSIIFLKNEEIIKVVPQGLSVVTLVTEEEKNEYEQEN